MHSWVRVVLCLREKKKKKTNNKNWNFAHLYLGNSWRDLLRFWNVASPYRRALPQQIWCSSDKRWRINGCVKITTLLFLLIYSLPFARALFCLAARHTTVCLDKAKIIIIILDRCLSMMGLAWAVHFWIVNECIGNMQAARAMF